MGTYKVINPFIDKETKEKFGVGSEYYTEDHKRVGYLKDWGYLGEDVEPSEEEPIGEEDGIRHVGGGYYELPNGEKVKGKDKALETLKEQQGSEG